MTSLPTHNVIDNNLRELITALDNSSGSDTYPIEKLAAHQRNIPHLAVSIFVFRNEQLLLQKRADSKYHSGGLWTNTVCSHPRWQESALQCADRRLNEELGWHTSIKEFGKISYSAKVGQLYENEQVHCFYGHLVDDCEIKNFNRDEVSAVGWHSVPEILSQIQQHPAVFTEWFKIYMTDHREMIQSLIKTSQQGKTTVTRTSPVPCT